MDFDKKLGVIERENGWGKSTFSVFIKVMLYGFAHERSRNEQENERKRYRPWNHGVYGGSIHISTGKGEYVITKIFGEKEKDDEIQIIDIKTGRKLDDFRENIGKWLLEIDEESFRRTAFITSSDTGTGESDDINAKLGNLVNDTEDVNRYENICRTLQDYLNKMSPSRKTGYLYKMKEEKMNLEKELLTGEDIEHRIELTGKKLNRLKEEENDLLIRLKALKKEKINANNDLKSGGFSGIIKSVVFIIPAAFFIFIHNYIPGTILLVISAIVWFMSSNNNNKAVYFSRIEELDDETDAVSEELQRVRSDMILCRSDIKELKNYLSDMDDVSRRLKELKEEYEIYEREYRVAEKTRHYIIQAKENLTSGYLVPVLKYFKKYLSLFEGMDFQIDINMNIIFRENGMQRDAAFLSNGYHDIVNICLRMALISAMYESEVPFIIMDDVFVHLDDKRLMEAGRFLEKLSERYQIIYFTAARANNKFLIQ